MPFDGTYFPAPKMPDTGLSPIRTKKDCRLLIGACFRRGSAVARRAFYHTDLDIDVAQLLRNARGLIEDPQSWTQRRYRTFDGRRCAVGALRVAAKGLWNPRIAWSAYAVLNSIARSRGFSSAEQMNDRSSHSDILGAFDSAITAASGAALEAACRAALKEEW